MTSRPPLDSDDANIVLAGFMGTGKSTIGRALAAQLDRVFVDTDLLIEESHGPIGTIFAAQGEAAFRTLEERIAVELSEQRDAVIATGGGFFLNPANTEVLASTGRIFCLRADIGEVIRRIQADASAADRPLLMDPDPLFRAASLYAERQSIYMQFEQVDTDDRGVDDIVADIISRLG